MKTNELLSIGKLADCSTTFYRFEGPMLNATARYAVRCKTTLAVLATSDCLEHCATYLGALTPTDAYEIIGPCIICGQPGRAQHFTGAKVPCVLCSDCSHGGKQ